VLVLAGTAEARELCAALAAAGHGVLASLSGAVREPRPLGVPTRVGGFGGAAGFLRVLTEERIGAVVDATHPFAAAISARSAMICVREGVPFLRLDRPGWVSGEGDPWSLVDDAGEAAALAGRAAVFLAAGRGAVAAFAGYPGAVWCRVIDPAVEDFPLPHGGWVVGRPPFAVEEEVALFRRLGVGVLVAKDSGAAEAGAKLAAARELGLPVIMLRRPAGVRPCVATVAEAVAWVGAL
jgi:precorrin-6A/cobalt-precorrin-6A reductase